MAGVSYEVSKYCGGTYCGNGGGFKSLDDAMEWADDGFCDYARISKEREDGTVQTLKVHFEPTERDSEWYASHDY